MTQTHTAQETLIPMQTNLWNEFAETVSKQGKRPMRVAAQLLREYIEIQQDLALFDAMRRDVKVHLRSDAEAVAFVHKMRREKRLASNGKRPRRSARKQVKVT